LATGPLVKHGRGRFSLSGTPVFLYHGLTRSVAMECPQRERKYWVSAGQFRKQLATIRTERCQVALLRELRNSTEVFERSNQPIALTFDDGHCSDYEIAFPLLLEAGVRAEFFVNTATVGRKGFLSWEQISEMQRAGMSFESHSHDHVDLSRLPFREKERQLQRSKQMLEDRLGSEVEFLAVPYGRLSPQVVEVAIETGYRALCTSWSWPARPGAQLVNRVAVYAYTRPYGFRGLLLGRAASYAIRAARGFILYLPKRVLLRFFRPQVIATVLEDLS